MASEPAFISLQNKISSHHLWDHIHHTYREGELPHLTDGPTPIRCWMDDDNSAHTH